MWFNRTILYIYLKNTYKSKCFDTKILIFPLAVNICGFKHAVITVIWYELATISRGKDKGLGRSF